MPLKRQQETVPPSSYGTSYGNPTVVVAANDGNQISNSSPSLRPHILAALRAKLCTCQAFIPLGNALWLPSCQPECTGEIIYGKHIAHQVWDVSFALLVMGVGQIPMG
jgi:hypothetical protein